jgi:hypothetical protein
MSRGRLAGFQDIGVRRQFGRVADFGLGGNAVLILVPRMALSGPSSELPHRRPAALFDRIASRAFCRLSDRRIGSGRLRLRRFARAERRWSLGIFPLVRARPRALWPAWVRAGAADCSRLKAPATRRDVPGP